LKVTFAVETRQEFTNLARGTIPLRYIKLALPSAFERT